MPSQQKLIKTGIKYTDKLFDEISKRLEKGVKASDSLEAFLDKYHKAFPNKGNPLISLGYDKRMLDLILSETNNHRFSRPAQKELVRVTVEEKVGELIVDVGEDIKDSVRDIVRDGYNRNLSQDEIALNISNRVSAIKGKRARAIARTEIARTATVSDYVINRERGANGWYVECRNTACPVCKDRWHKGWTPEIDDSFEPSDSSAGGKGWIGDRIFSMNDTSMLPPIHPSCRCVVYYTSEEPNVSTEPVQQTTSVSTTLISGEPTIVKEIIPGDGGVTSYTFDNDVKIVIHDSSNVEINDIVSHIESLPEVIQNLENVKRFEIKSAENKEAHSSYNPHEQIITIETIGNSSQLRDTLTHELAHAVDYASGKTGKTRLSNVSTYSQIHEKDSQYHIYEDPKTGEKRIIGEFPTNYAEKMYYVNKKLYEEAVEWKNQAPDKRTMNSSDERFQEDFAESSKLYLNPKTHDEFVKKFPNRADYLEMIYGKPKFKK